MKIILETSVTFFIILFSLEISKTTQFGITINQNGYEGVTVAISDKIENSPALIQKIKEHITETSRLLYTATKYQLYFKNVTIVLPKTWSVEDGYQKISGSKFTRAHIRIDEEHPVVGKVPYVYGQPMCGKSGQYMHLTQYLMFAGKFAGFGEMVGNADQDSGRQIYSFQYGVRSDIPQLKSKYKKGHWASEESRTSFQELRLQSCAGVFPRGGWVNTLSMRGSQVIIRKALEKRHTPCRIKTSFISIAAVLVHEWGHLRWGLFDEYAAIEEPSLNPPPSFSNEDNTWKPVRCTDQVSGRRIHRETGVLCSTLTSDNIPDKDCIFVPDENAQATASLMGHQNVKTMAEFCDKDDQNTDASVRHNSRIKNNQNIRCGERSAWEVMRDHPDFIAISPGSANKDTTPHFTIEIESDQRICLSLDVSGSMNTNDRIDKLYTAVSNFLLNYVATGTSVGIVKFNSQATIVNQVMTVSNQTVREQLVSSLPTSAFGLTSIGAGILTCISALNVSSDGLQGSIIYLVTDGEETTAPYIADVQPMVVDLGIIVTTLALGNQADTNLGTISRASGGKSFFYSEDNNSTTLMDAFTSTAVVDSSSDQSIQIYSFSFQLSSSMDFQRSVIIDDTIGKDTLFQVITNGNIQINITVTGPDGTVYREFTSNSGITTLKIAGVALTGAYTIVVTTTTDNIVTPVLSIQSKPRTAGSSVITANVWLSDDTHSYSSESHTVVYVSVMKGLAPIFKAEAFVNIESYGNITVKQLLDNGIGSDIREDDGIYSGYIFSSAFNGDGRHSFKVDVHSLDDKAELLVSSTKSDTFPYYSGLTTNPVGNFQRIVLSNELTVTNYTTGPLLDTIEPAKITSLSLKSVQDSTGKIKATFTWKAVGDDLDIGTASEYEIRMSDTFETIKKHPEQSTRLTQNIPVPGIAGTLEEIVIDFDDDSTTKYISLRSIDEAGNKGDFSNIVSVSRLTDPSWSVGVVKSSLTLWQVSVSGCIALLILVTGIVIFIVCIKTVSSKQQKFHEESQRKHHHKQRVRWSNTQSYQGPWWHHALGDHRSWLHHAVYDHRPWWHQEKHANKTDKSQKSSFNYRRERFPV